MAAWRLAESAGHAALLSARPPLGARGDDPVHSTAPRPTECSTGRSFDTGRTGLQAIEWALSAFRDGAHIRPSAVSRADSVTRLPSGLRYCKCNENSILRAFPKPARPRRLAHSQFRAKVGPSIFKLCAVPRRRPNRGPRVLSTLPGASSRGRTQPPPATTISAPRPRRGGSRKRTGPNHWVCDAGLDDAVAARALERACGNRRR